MHKIQKTPSQIETARLRAGLLMVLFWWLQLPVLIVVLAPFFGYDPVSKGVARASLIMMIIQNIVGGIGVIIAGRPLVHMVRKTPKKQVPKVLWRSLRKGTLDPV